MRYADIKKASEDERQIKQQQQQTLITSKKYMSVFKNKT